MKEFYVTALETTGYPEYPVPNWIEGNRYKATDKGHTLTLESETGNFHFAGKARDQLPEIFKFEDGESA